MGSGMGFLARKVRKTLACAQAKQEVTFETTSDIMLGHPNFSQTHMYTAQSDSMPCGQRGMGADSHLFLREEVGETRGKC